MQNVLFFISVINQTPKIPQKCLDYVRWLLQALRNSRKILPPVEPGVNTRMEGRINHPHSTSKVVEGRQWGTKNNRQNEQQLWDALRWWEIIYSAALEILAVLHGNGTYPKHLLQILTCTFGTFDLTEHMSRPARIISP